MQPCLIRRDAHLFGFHHSDGTKEMMQPCLICLHFISLVAQPMVLAPPHLLRHLHHFTTKEMMQPCLIYLHAHLFGAAIHLFGAASRYETCMFIVPLILWSGGNMGWERWLSFWYFWLSVNFLLSVIFPLE